MKTKKTLLIKYSNTDYCGNVDFIYVYSNGVVVACGSKTRIPMSLANYTGTGLGFAGMSKNVREAARKGLDAMRAICYGTTEILIDNR